MSGTIEVLICDGVRTPFGKYGGALSGIRPDDLAAVPIRSLIERNPHVDWDLVDDVYYGCANQSGEDNRNVARMAALLGGLPVAVPGSTINRLCGSSLDAIALGARSIRSGEADLIIAGGIESMTRAPFVVGKAESSFSRSLTLEDTTLGWRFVNPLMRDTHGVDSMAETAENLVRKYGVSREDQDAFAVRSQQRYARAAREAFFEREIVPITVTRPRGEGVIFTMDEHPRSDTTLEKLAKLKGVVRADGSVTAGNSSGINDGAGAVLLASETAAERYGLKPRARILGCASAGVEPRLMGIGPVPATRKLLARTGFRLTEMDVIELNEAFAAQSLVVLRELGISEGAEEVNPNGGAIAIGHPLGASGVRLALTAINQLEHIGARLALCTMCIGVGQGISMLLERVT